MSLLTILGLVGGLALLLVGAELLVRGAARLSTMLGMSPLVVGLTVVAFGTSAPELAVGVQGVVTGQGDVSVGNVVGSNIMNVLFILGLAAVIAPLVVAQRLVRVEVPLMIAVSILPLWMGQDGVIGRLDGAILFAGIVLFIVWTIRSSRREEPENVEAYVREYVAEPGRPGGHPAMLVFLVVAGLAMLVLGSSWVVDSAVTMAESFGLSELVISLTVISAGTSLPEAATSVVASFKGEGDIAVGNVVGSNFFNILSVLGLTALVAPGGIAVAPAAVAFDIPVMIAVSVACLPIFFSGHRIARWEGGLFLGYYVAYTAYLLLRAWEHDALQPFSDVMVTFVMPLTIVTVLVVAGRAALRQRPG
ncbi:MAG: calcium/sodium antiporter [Myxococcota bacterium]